MDQGTCGVCGQSGRVCRFERACSCWRGVPCANRPAWVARNIRKDQPLVAVKELAR